MTTTTTNFKSAVWGIMNCSNIDDSMNWPLFNQRFFIRIKPTKQLDDDETMMTMKQFTTKNIDRLYYLFNYDNERFHLIARINHYNYEGEEEDYYIHHPPLYVELAARYDPLLGWKGLTYVSSNVNLFMKLCLPKLKKEKRNPIYELLKQDNVEIDKNLIMDYQEYWNAVSYSLLPTNVELQRDEKFLDAKRAYEEPINNLLSIFDHPNFKSAQPLAGKPNVIYKNIMPLLVNQRLLSKRKIIIMDPNNDKELNFFTLQAENIDRLYYIYSDDKKAPINRLRDDDDDDRKLLFKNNNNNNLDKLLFHIIARVNYKNQIPLYVELAALYDPNYGKLEDSFSDRVWDGFILLSTNVELFMRLCLPKMSENVKNNVYKFLRNDDELQQIGRAHV